MKKRKVLFFLTFVSVCLLAFSIYFTYAKYTSNFEKGTNINLTKWRLKINNSDISNNSDFSQSLTPVIDSNPHIANNVIAPTSTGHFDIEIDPSEIDLSFSYSITINNTISAIQDYKVTGYSIDNGSPLAFNNTPITNTILFDDSHDSITYRFFVEWDDSQNNTTNNAEDTQLAINQETATINVHISFEQIADSI